MKSNLTLSVAVVALLGMANANVPQKAAAPPSPVHVTWPAQANTQHDHKPIGIDRAPVPAPVKAPASNAQLQLSAEPKEKPSPVHVTWPSQANTQHDHKPIGIDTAAVQLKESPVAVTWPAQANTQHDHKPIGIDTAAVQLKESPVAVTWPAQANTQHDHKPIGIDRAPVSNSHVQLQQTQQVDTNANQVIYAKSHIGGGAKLDKEHTTLTIVQDFPKKKPDQNVSHNIEMVQSHEQIHQQSNIQIATQVNTDKKSASNQTVEQKVKANNEAVAVTVNHLHKKSKNKNIDEGIKSTDDNDKKKISLTIVQDFRKKPAEKPPVNMEMLQQKEHESLNINEKEKKLTTKKKENGKKTTTLTIVQEFPKKKADLEKERVPEANEMINHKQEINIKSEHKVAKVEHHQSFMMFEFNKATDFLWKVFGFSN